MLVAEAFAGAGAGELLKAVIDLCIKTKNFSSILSKITQTLQQIEPMVNKIEAQNRKLGQQNTELQDLLERGKSIVEKCSSARKRWNPYDRHKYSKKLRRFNDDLLRFSQLNMQLVMAVAVGEIQGTLNNLNIGSMQLQYSCQVPDPPEFVVGFQGPVNEVKMALLGEASTVLITGAGGYGKTTLAKLICHDHLIKGKFGKILFVTLSRMANFQVIVQKIIEHNGLPLRHEFQSDEDAKNQLGLMLKEIGCNILLVLDDVWPQSDSFIQKFMFPIAGYKLMVTSRFTIPGPHFTYKMDKLNDEDAMRLFCQSTNADNVPSDLLKEIVKACKGSPLVLMVLGQSLYSPNEVTLRIRLQKWSEDRSILNSCKDVLDCLQTSVDALDEMPIVRECYLDLGLFPEDEKIPSTALMDLWVELYDFDEKGLNAYDKLDELSRRNLAKLIVLRNDGGQDSGYCNEHFVIQHDLLRELAIRLSSLSSVEQRERLIIEITGNDLPDWWIKQKHQPILARILSISTDETFSGSWYDMELPEAKALILNFRSKNYNLPPFMSKMNQLSALIVTNYGLRMAELNYGQLFLSNLKRIRLERIIISSLGASLLRMMNLRKISLSMCEIGTAFESRFTVPHALPSLVEIEIDYCDDLEKFPVELCKIASLKRVSITHCSVLIELPEDIGRLINLEVLRLNSCRKLAGLPESIANLQNLIALDISDCWCLSKLPARTGELCGLRRLYMKGCHELSELPLSVKQLTHLQEVTCDEQISDLWKLFTSHLTDLYIREPKEDAVANLMRVISFLHN